MYAFNDIIPCAAGDAKYCASTVPMVLFSQTSSPYAWA